MGTDEIAEVIRASYAAYAASDRASLEPLIADDFTFSSPDDPGSTGESSRNAEFLRVRDGQLVRAEVYY
jgi:ketosteroid isomerase-like protein